MVSQFWREVGHDTLWVLIVLGVLLLISQVVSATEFNLTCTVSERYLYWQFDNDTYNISVDGSNATEFTGAGYLVTNLRPDTMHMLSISNATNSTLDYQTTMPTFWDTWFFRLFMIGIFFMILGYGFGAEAFTMIAWFTMLMSVFTALATWGVDTTDVLNNPQVYMGLFGWIGVTWRWLAQHGY